MTKAKRYEIASKIVYIKPRQTESERERESAWEKEKRGDKREELKGLQFKVIYYQCKIICTIKSKNKNQKNKMKNEKKTNKRKTRKKKERITVINTIYIDVAKHGESDRWEKE